MRRDFYFIAEYFKKAKYSPDVVLDISSGA